MSALLRGHTSPKTVELIEALAHPSRPARRVLELAAQWPVSVSVSLPTVPVCKTARQLRPAEVDELVAAYQAGSTVFHLSDKFGITRQTVGKHLRSRGVDTTPPELHPADVPRAAELYRQGWSLVRIGERFDASPNTVRAQLREAGDNEGNTLECQKSKTSISSSSSGTSSPMAPGCIWSIWSIWSI